MTERPASDEPICLSCGAAEIVDTDHHYFPWMCLACGCWGPTADQVERELDSDLPPHPTN